MSSEYCLQCGESRAAVERERIFCTAGGHAGEPDYEWDRHRWRDWTDKELAAVGVLPEHYDKYRDVQAHDLVLINCHDRGREHIPLEEDERVCWACWHDMAGKETETWTEHSEH